MRFSFLLLFLLSFSFLLADTFLDNIKENHLLSPSEIEYLEYLQENPIYYRDISPEFLKHYFFLTDLLSQKIYNALINKKLSRAYFKKNNLPLNLITILKHYIKFSKIAPLHNYYLATKYKKKPYSYTFKYNYQNNNITFGTVLQKDEKDIKPFDYKSFYLQFKKKNLNLIIGNYILDFGIFNTNQTGFSDPFFIKNNYLRFLYPNRSTYENFNLFGGGFKYDYKKIFILPFISYSYLSAKIKNNKISSFDYNGIHTSTDEKVKEEIIGFAFSYKVNNFFLIYDFHSEKFDKGFFDKAYCKLNYFHNLNITYKFKSLFFSSYNSFANAKKAFLQKLSWGDKTLLQQFSFRFYQKYYPMWHSNPYSHQSQKNNEIGWLYKINYRATQNLNLYFYQDLYRQLEPVNGFLNKGSETGSLIYFKKKKVNLRIKYKYKLKDETVSSLQKLSKSNDVNFYIKNNIDKNITLKSYFAFADKKISGIYKNGFLTYQQIGIKIRNSNLLLRFTSTKTNTPIYVYENSIRGIFQVTLYSGDDMRFFIKFRYSFFKKLKLEMKFENSFIYSDKQTIYLALYGEL